MTTLIKPLQAVCLILVISISFKTYSQSNITSIWFHSGEDKVTKDELRGSVNANSVLNSVWDGNKVKLFAAKNEVIAFHVVLESQGNPSSNVSVSLNNLYDGVSSNLTSQPASGDQLFEWVGRNIELFYVRYLEIKGLSRFGYETYDERHIPEKLRRPYDAWGIGTGTWNDRPNHNKFYPDIAVPIELHPSFSIPSNENQSIAVDIYVPKDAVNGIYTGNIVITEDGATTEIPVELTVCDFELPDEPSSKTMLYLGYGDICMRYTGMNWPNPGTWQDNLSTEVRNRHFLMAHRHKISLIDGNNGASAWGLNEPRPTWIPILNGSLFTAANGYDGPGINTGNTIFSIGSYGSWQTSWDPTSRVEMEQNTDAWETWFQNNSPNTERFLYLVDESANYAETEQWAQWVAQNPGVGSQLPTMATINLPTALASTPSLSIPTSTMGVGIANSWENSNTTLQADPSKKLYMYNGKRPSTGTFMTDDEGTALRQLPWAQFKKGVDRWFYWESTYYNNYQAGMGQTNVFQTAKSFGGCCTADNNLGETGWNYSNGDGLLFYPGTDNVFPAESYNINGPIASLRLKHWRRGIQDVDYINLAMNIDPTATMNIVNAMIPKVMWEYGVNDVNDPSWVRTPISWSEDPEDWNEARRQLMEIIGGCAIAPLSVELEDFSASLFKAESSNEQVKTFWTTKSEINCDYFIVEKSFDGKFWEEVGKVDGSGNSSEPINYSLIDDSPFAGLSYYRLVQVDYNGGKALYGPVSINIEGLELIKIYPNPASNEINYIIDASVNSNISISINDISGRKIKESVTRVYKGLNQFKENVEQLSTGIYLIRVITEDGRFKDQLNFFK